MANGKINVDYIGVVSEREDGKLEYKQVEIDMPLFKELLGKLEDMKENPNRTIFDMQDLFMTAFPQKSSVEAYSYCHPHSYNSTFLDSARYPSIYSFEDFQKEIDYVRNDAKKRECPDASQPLTPEMEQKIDEAMERAQNNLNSNSKHNFLRKATRYIKAYCYHKTVDRLKKEQKNRMFSSEEIGWSDFDYDVTKNVKFQVKSNFGYGSSAYFFVNLEYMGISILPYTALVNYYYANMVDLIRYTRQYRPCSENWDLALSFVVDTSNDALVDEKAFVEKWIVNEIREMMSGLERIAVNPRQEHERLMKNRGETGLCLVRNIIREECFSYKVYPREMTMAFQAEKITGALHFLENLEKLKAIYPVVEQCISRIKDLNVAYKPRLINMIQEIEDEITKRKAEIEQLEQQIQKLIAKRTIHSKEIEQLVEEHKAQGEDVSYSSIEQQYKKDHPDYAQLCDSIEALIHKREECSYDAHMREQFAERLRKCLSCLENHLLAAA